MKQMGPEFATTGKKDHCDAPKRVPAQNGLTIQQVPVPLCHTAGFLGEMEGPVEHPGFKDPPGEDKPDRCHLTGALATACGDDSVRVFQEDEPTDPDQPVFSLAACAAKAHNQDVNCVNWHPKEAGILASCSDDGDIAIWRYQTDG